MVRHLLLGLVFACIAGTFAIIVRRLPRKPEETQGPDRPRPWLNDWDDLILGLALEIYVKDELVTPRLDGALLVLSGIFLVRFAYRFSIAWRKSRIIALIGATAAALSLFYLSEAKVAKDFGFGKADTTASTPQIVQPARQYRYLSVECFENQNGTANSYADLRWNSHFKIPEFDIEPYVDPRVPASSMGTCIVHNDGTIAVEDVRLVFGYVVLYKYETKAMESHGYDFAAIPVPRIDKQSDYIIRFVNDLPGLLYSVVPGRSCSILVPGDPESREPCTFRRFPRSPPTIAGTDIELIPYRSVNDCDASFPPESRRKCP